MLQGLDEHLPVILSRSLGAQDALFTLRARHRHTHGLQIERLLTAFHGHAFVDAVTAKTVAMGVSDSFSKRPAQADLAPRERFAISVNM